MILRQIFYQYTCLCIHAIVWAQTRKFVPKLQTKEVVRTFVASKI